MNKKNEKSLMKAQGNGAQNVKLSADFGELYVKVQNGQILRPIKARMALSQEENHLYYANKKYNITSDGYRHLNKVASVSILTPQSVIVDGKEMPNPYIERHERTKITKSVYIRKIGIGYSPAGNITVMDMTLHYNLYTYFIQSIQAKMNKKVWESGKETGPEFPDCAEIGIKDVKPEKDGKWVWYEMEDPLGIWVNYEDPAIISCMEEHTQRQRFADRIAQTIVERNILKKHPAIGVAQVNPIGSPRPQDRNAKALVTVFGYRHEFTMPKINDILERAERGDENIDVKEEVIEVDQEEEEAVKKEVVEEEKTMDEKDEGFRLTQEEENE